MTTKITSDNIDATVGTGADVDKNAFNISLLGFKMAVNEGLTVFNLVDGVVDEFNDESGTDEAEGSNDTYCGTGDYYQNGVAIDISAGFSISSITEPDTSTAGANPGQGTSTAGEFTVPSGFTSMDVKMWGAGGGGGDHGGNGTSCEAVGGGGGGYVEGTIATSPGTVFDVYVGEGGESLNVLLYLAVLGAEVMVVLLPVQAPAEDFLLLCQMVLLTQKDKVIQLQV